MRNIKNGARKYPEVYVFKPYDLVNLVYKQWLLGYIVGFCAEDDKFSDPEWDDLKPIGGGQDDKEKCVTKVMEVLDELKMRRDGTWYLRKDRSNKVVLKEVPQS